MPVVSSHGPTTPLPSDLSKLNVSQLKALCKERRIVGYSKLGKAALLSKLRELTLPAPSAQSTGPQADSSSPNAGPSHPSLDGPPVGVPVADPGASISPPSLPNPLGSNEVPGAHIPKIPVASAFGSSL